MWYMESLKPLEPGVMFWTGRDHVAEVKELGVRCGQLGIDPSFEFSDAAVEDWSAALTGCPLKDAMLDSSMTALVGVVAASS